MYVFIYIYIFIYSFMHYLFICSFHIYSPVCQPVCHPFSHRAHWKYTLCGGLVCKPGFRLCTSAHERFVMCGGFTACFYSAGLTNPFLFFCSLVISAPVACIKLTKHSSDSTHTVWWGKFMILSGNSMVTCRPLTMMSYSRVLKPLVGWI